MVPNWVAVAVTVVALLVSAATVYRARADYLRAIKEHETLTKNEIIMQCITDAYALGRASREKEVQNYARAYQGILERLGEKAK